MTLPSGRTVTWGYNVANRTNVVGGTPPGGTAKQYTSAAAPISYTSQGAISQMTLANGFVENRSYDIYRQQPIGVTLGTSTNPSSMLALGLSYCANSSPGSPCTTNNGNLQSQSVAPLGATQTYTYEGFNRLNVATAAGVWSETFNYDNFGNHWVPTNGYYGITISPLTAIAQSNYNANNRNTVNNDFNYDNNSNQTGISPFTVYYDVENRQTSITSTMNGSATYTYDGEGRRVSKTAVGTTTTTTTYLYDAAGQLSAEYSTSSAPPCTTCFLTADYLCSTRLVTDENGDLVCRRNFLPFGEELTTANRTAAQGYCGSDNITEKFTGKERDAELASSAMQGLDYFGARYFSGAQGRWTSPDAINLTDERILNPSNTLNKYIYGGNNPLKYTDPDGRDITVFYSNIGPAGHFWMVASDPAGQQSAILDFGPAAGASRVSEALGLDVPGDTHYAAHMPSADEIRQDYTSLTIQTNPVDTQNAINAINSTNASLRNYHVYGPNCTTVCRDILYKILGLNTNSIRPTALWSDVFLNWSKQAMQPRQSTSRGSAAPQILSTHGVDYGNPRYGMNTFDFAWILLQQQNQQPPQPQVTSKFCYTDENGKQVCQQ